MTEIINKKMSILTTFFFSKIFQTDTSNNGMRRTNEKPQVGEHHHKTDQDNQILKRHKREGQFPKGMRFINVRHKNIFFQNDLYF
jgi:hypothetical protein